LDNSTVRKAGTIMGDVGVDWANDATAAIIAVNEGALVIAAGGGVAGRHPFDHYL
jgi:hypothetical protein